MPTTPRGITLTPAEITSVGLEAILDTITRTGANALSISLGVLLPGRQGGGTREPPLDVEDASRGAGREPSPRRLDDPLRRVNRGRSGLSRPPVEHPKAQEGQQIATLGALAASRSRTL